MDFALPEDLRDYLAELDEFIEREIKPLEQQDDNIRFFDHRREDARTDWDRGGLPEPRSGRRCCARPAAAPTRPATTATRSRRSTAARTARTSAWPSSASTSPRKGLGLHCDLQNEHAIVGNNVGLLLMINYGTEEQKAEWIDDLAEGRRGFAFGITEPEHGSDATYMETTAVRDGDEWVINGEKTWNTGIHAAHVRPDLRPHERQAGRRRRHHRVPRADRRARASRSSSSCGRSTCRPTTRTSGSPTCACPTRAIFGGEGRGLQVVQHFFNENRIRQAASSLGAAAVLHRPGRSSTRRSASRSASRWRPTRRSSSRSSSCRRSARCCAR